MPKFEPRTFPDFFERMMNRVVGRTELTDLEIGGVLTTIVGAMAREFDGISYQIVALQDLFDIDTATGADLDARALDFNPDEISRKPPLKATGTVVFGRTDTSAPVTIGAGTLVAVVGGSPTYTTAVDVTIPILGTESAPVLVECTAAGSLGNVDVGDPSIPTGISEIVVSVAGVETVTNVTACTGGQDYETDLELRERLKAYTRSLPRATPDALKYAVLGLAVDGYGRIVVAQIEELEEPNYGKVFVWIDDGNGTTEVTGDTGGTPEVVVLAATGGELRLQLAHNAINAGFTHQIAWTDSTGTIGLPGSTYFLTEGSPGDPPGSYDYLLNYATGKITLNPGGALPLPKSPPDPVSGLQPGDSVFALYGWFGGLISEAQRVIDGDPADRENYPGYRAAGVYVQVKAPVVYWQIIEATIVVELGYDVAEVGSLATAAVEQYVNSLTINGDVIFSEMVYAVQSIEGVFDVTFTSPDHTALNPNVLIGAGELARTSASFISITGA